MNDAEVMMSSVTAAAALAERLHRLRASCGICGALRLRDAAARLEASLLNDAAHAEENLRAFYDALRATSKALAADQENDS